MPPDPLGAAGDDRAAPCKPCHVMSRRCHENVDALTARASDIRGQRGNRMTDRSPGSPRHPRADRELGVVARRAAMGALPHRLARRRAHDGDLVPGQRRRIHQGEPGRLRQGRAHPAFPRRHVDRSRRRPRHRADQDDDRAARAGRGRHVRRGLHRPLLRFSGKARRPLGSRAAPADLREGPARSGRSGGDAFSSTRTCSSNFPKAIATSPICRRASATRSRPTCRASTGRKSRSFTRAARPGSRAQPI